MLVVERLDWLLTLRLCMCMKCLAYNGLVGLVGCASWEILMWLMWWSKGRWDISYLFIWILLHSTILSTILSLRSNASCLVRGISFKITYRTTTHEIFSQSRRMYFGRIHLNHIYIFLSHSFSHLALSAIHTVAHKYSWKIWRMDGRTENTCIFPNDP